MAKSDNQNIYQDIASIKERDKSAEHYETYRPEELETNVLSRSNSGCTWCCQGNRYTKTCILGLLIVVVLGAIGGGIAMFVKATTSSDCQCHFVMPDGYTAESQTGSNGQLGDTKSSRDAGTSTGSAPTINAVQKNDEVKVVTTVFTRWGRTDCTNKSTTLYSGYTAGSSHKDYGGTSSILCLPENPQYGNFKSGRSYSYLHGAEYDSSNPELEEIFGKTIQNNDIPCAVCEVTGRGTILMIPACQQCFDGWTLEYSGYLMSSHVNDKRTMDAICVDSNPEVLHGGSQDSNGARFFFMEVEGQMPVPPYIKEAELTCVICSK